MDATASTKPNVKIVPWLYFSATLSSMVCNTVAGSYIAFYMTERMLISAALMGVVMIIARGLDLALGLVCGAIIQKTQLKPGQYRFWLLWAPVACGIGTTLLFINPNIPIAAKAVMVIIGYMGYGGGMSFIQTSQNGMLAKIAGSDFNLRLSIAAKVNQGNAVGRLLTAMITLPLINYFSSKGADGYTVVQVIFATLGVAGQMILFVGTKAFEKYDPDFKGSQTAIGPMLSSTLKNGQLLILMLADTLRYTVMMFLALFNMYYFTYVAGDRNMMTLFLTISSVLSVFGAFIAQPIAKKAGKKNSAMLTGVIGIAGYLCMLFFGGVGKGLVYIIFCSIATLGSMIITSVGVNLYLDCAEYQLFTTGQDNRTFVMSMYGVTVKLAFVIASLVVSSVLMASGYSATAEGGSVADPARMHSLVCYTAVGMYVCYLLLMAFAFKLTDEKSKEYAEANAAKASQGQ